MDSGAEPTKKKREVAKSQKSRIIKYKNVL